MHDKVSGAESWWSGLVTEVFEALTPCRARKPALCGTARRCPMKGLQIRVWSWSWSSKPKYCAAVAVCAQLPQLIERSAFVRSRRYSSSSLEHDSPADSKIVAGAAILVENGPHANGSIARSVWFASFVEFFWVEFLLALGTCAFRWKLTHRSTKSYAFYRGLPCRALATVECR